MKKTLFTIALSGMLALSAQAALYAQDAGGQQQGQWQGHREGMNPERQLEHLTKVLNLSADQQSQIKPILESRQQKMQALFQNQSLSREERHSQMESIHQSTKTQIESVLNDQQKQQFEAMHEHGPRGGNNQPQATPQPQ
jgi:hypothetical protein